MFGQTKYCDFYSPDNQGTDIYIEECKYKNCYFTCDKSNMNKSDAMIFHESDIYNEQYWDNQYINK